MLIGMLLVLVLIVDANAEHEYLPSLLSEGGSLLPDELTNRR